MAHLNDAGNRNNSLHPSKNNGLKFGTTYGPLDHACSCNQDGLDRDFAEKKVEVANKLDLERPTVVVFYTSENAYTIVFLAK
jgi:hypothetical protein